MNIRRIKNTFPVGNLLFIGLLVSSPLLVGGSAFAQFPSPSPEHAVLKKEVGTWDATISIYTAPDGSILPTPMTEKGVETNKLVGSFWLVSSFKGNFAGMPFEGHGTQGFDPVKKKFVGQWIDSLSVTPMTMEGTYDDEKKTLSMKSEIMSPDGELVKGRSVAIHKDENTRSVVMFNIIDGKETKTMAIEYVRKK